MLDRSDVRWCQTLKDGRGGPLQRMAATRRPPGYRPHPPARPVPSPRRRARRSSTALIRARYSANSTPASRWDSCARSALARASAAWSGWPSPSCKVASCLYTSIPPPAPDPPPPAPGPGRPLPDPAGSSPDPRPPRLDPPPPPAHRQPLPTDPASPRPGPGRPPGGPTRPAPCRWLPAHSDSPGWHRGAAPVGPPPGPAARPRGLAPSPPSPAPGRPAPARGPRAPGRWPVRHAHQWRGRARRPGRHGPSRPRRAPRPLGPAAQPFVPSPGAVRHYPSLHPMTPPRAVDSPDAVPLGQPESQPWGHIGATSLPSVRDNNGHQRSSNAAAQQPFPASITGHPTTPVLSDTEEVTGSNPVAPTNKALTSGNAAGPSLRTAAEGKRALYRFGKRSTELGPLHQDKSSDPCLCSCFPPPSGRWGRRGVRERFPDRPADH